MSKLPATCARTAGSSLRAGWSFKAAMFPCDCEVPGKPTRCDGRYGKCRWQRPLRRKP